jgi:UPF0716 family protein affecting phage T7 exclusion
MAARRRGRTARPDSALFVDLGFVLALVAVGAVAAWPIYQTWYLAITVAGAVAIAAPVVVVGRLRNWSWLMIAGVAAAAYLAFGVPLAIPSAFASRADFLAGYRDLIVATVTDWKKLVTVDAPVGHFQTLLVPLLVTMLVCTTVAFSITFGRARSYGALVPVMLLPTAFAIVFGTTGPGHSVPVGDFQIASGFHMLIGVLALGTAGGFLVWRAQHARTLALREAAAASGIRRPGGTAVGTVRRTAGAVAVALVGLAVAVPLSSTALQPSARHVLRSAVDPTAQLSQYTSPLTTYRAAFAAEPVDVYNAPVLSYSGDAQQLGRLRVATMSYYNGQQYTVLPNDSDRSSAFSHMPQLTSSTPAGGLAKLDVTIQSGFENALGADVWLPTVEGLKAIGFGGADVNALTDGFYYNTELQAGAELHPLDAGDSYTLLAKPQSAAANVNALTPPQGAVPETADIPDSLTQWVQTQGLGSDGQALSALIGRLRARGFLSHALVDPGKGTAAAPTWLAATGGKFQQSLAGESMDRIGDLFTELLRQQQEVGADAPAASLVAGVGDDEQFAVASALIAESLGFPARVVLGFTLPGGQADADAIPACQGGVCRGQNLTAWVEVQGADTKWVAFDTTPQHKLPLAEHPITTSVPKLPTQVQPHVATVQPPPEANPTGGNRQNNDRTPRSQAGPAVWLPVLRIGGTVVLVLLILAAPLISLVVVKAARRRDRRRAENSAGRIAAGWDELVDTAVDLGLPPPGVRTRAEAAALYAAASRAADSGTLRTLAHGADEAVFGAFDPTPDEAERFWAELDEQRGRLAEGFPRWKRLLALISLRSFRNGGGVT